MLQEQRYELILQYLREHGSLSMQELIHKLGVSRETVRRDLHEMEEQGLLTKVHGGAVLNKVAEEPPYATRTVSHQAEKRAIARAALELVEDGDTLFIDNGTTALEFANTLLHRQNLTVITHSLPVAVAAVERNVKVYLTGGFLRPGEFSLSGTLASGVLENFFVDKAFIGTGGITVPHGVTDFHVEESEIRKAVVRKASKTIILADHSKFGVTAFVRVVSIDEVDYVITDAETPASFIDSLKDAGVEVRVAVGE